MGVIGLITPFSYLLGQYYLQAAIEEELQTTFLVGIGLGFQSLWTSLIFICFFMAIFYLGPLVHYLLLNLVQSFYVVSSRGEIEARTGLCDSLGVVSRAVKAASIGGNSTLRGTPMTGAVIDGMSWSWNFSANGGNGGPDGGTVICPNGSVATPGYASGLPGAPSVGF
jgi:hypothetical protein